MSGPSGFADPAGGPAVELDHHGTDMRRMEEEAIRTLEELPEWLWDGTPPIPIERIAEDHFGLLVCETDDPSTVPGAPDIPPGNHFSGFLIAERGQIWVNASDAREWPPRKRFTIAHELGHWRLHREIAEVTFAAGEGKGLPLHEGEANAYAAALLMPAFLLRPEFERLGGDLDSLQSAFDSSRGALIRRLATLGLNPN